MGSSEPVLLVVDDEPATRKFVSEKVPWDVLGVVSVRQAINGYDALEKVKSLHPALIILDVKMPGLGGVALLERIQSEYHDPMAIIALSGYRDFDAAQKMIESRLVARYLLKPATPQELLEAGAASLEACGIDLKKADELALGHPESRQEELVYSAKQYIHEHYADRVTLSEAANQIHVSPSYLSRVFAACDGRGFNGYLSWYRIQRAKDRLNCSDSSIAGVAAASGFGDVRHFLRVFKKVEGRTPSEYRLQVMRKAKK